MSAQPYRSQPPSREPSLLAIEEEVRSVVELQPPPEDERRDETRQTGTIVQATNYLENKIYNIQLDVNQLGARLSRFETRVDDRLDNIEKLIRDQQAQQLRPTTEADQRGASRYPHNPLFHNTTSPEPTPSSASSRVEFKIKREDLGVFDPDAEDLKNSGVIMEGRVVVFTDVFSFEQRVLSLLEVEPELLPSINQQLVQLFGTCLNGSAMLWWINEVDQIKRQELRNQGIKALLTALVHRFKPTDIKAMDQLYKGRFYLREILGNEGALRQYFQRQYRLARALGITNEGSISPYAALLTIWRTLDLKSQTYLRQPRTSDTLAGYMQKIEDMTPLLVNAAEQSSRNPGFQTRYERQISQQKESTSRQYNEPSKSNHYPRRDEARDCDKDRAKPEEKSKQQYRDYNRRDFNQCGYDRRDRYRNQDRDVRGKGREVNQVEEDSEYDSDRSKSSASNSVKSEGANFVAEADRTCSKCEHVFNTITYKKSHESKKLCLPPHILQRQSLVTTDISPASPELRTCRRCHQSFESRNKLFRHLTSCVANPEQVLLSKEVSEIPKTSLVPELTHNTSVEQTSQLIIETPPPTQETTPFSSYTHLRIRAQSTQDGKGVDICADPGTGRSIIDRKWLETLEHTIIKKSSYIRGVGNKHTKVTVGIEAAVRFCD
jgi:hypothetical protein